MTAGEAATGLAWHPPQWLLEVVELVLAGALESAPADLDLPAEIAERVRRGPVVLEDAEGTPVAVLRAGPDPRPAAVHRPAAALGPPQPARRSGKRWRRCPVRAAKRRRCRWPVR